MKVLDHGSVDLIEAWGSDEAIIAAARQSTGGAFRGWGTPEAPGDERLLRYLWKHQHSTPFEFAGATFEVAAPIMVLREWMRHRVPFGYSEASARYSPLPDVNYLPTVERCMATDNGNKQAGAVAGAQQLTSLDASEWLSDLQELYDQVEAVYQKGLALGIPKELARLCLPVGRYSRMRVTANLRGWLGFLKLRMATDAQHEIREYANAVAACIAERFPRTWALFMEGRSNG